MKHLIYTLVALTWHHTEGKAWLPNLRLHVKEVMKQAQGVGGRENTLFQKEMTAFLSCISPDPSQETFIWVSLASRPARPPAGGGGVYPAFLSPALFPTASNPARKPSWVWPLGKHHLAPSPHRTSSLSLLRRPHGPDVENGNICIFLGVPSWDGVLLVWENSEPFLRRLPRVMLRTATVLWVLVRLAQGGQAGEARRWPCGGIEQW